MVAPPGRGSSSWDRAWGPRTAAGKAPGSAITGESHGPTLALPAAAGRGRGITQPGFNFMEEIPPPGSLPTGPSSAAGNCLPQGPFTSWQCQQMWKPRLGPELADSGWGVGLVPDTPHQCSQPCISFSRSANIYGVSVQGQSLGPSFVLAVRKSGSNDGCFKKPNTKQALTELSFSSEHLLCAWHQAYPCLA